jgi:hypothetical protein
MLLHADGPDAVAAQVYKAMRHGMSEVAVKMVKCVVRVLSSELRGHTEGTPINVAVQSIGSCR